MFLMDFELSKRNDRCVYYCNDCRHNRREHAIIDKAGPITTHHSFWGPGLPTVKRQCTECGMEDGPWIGTVNRDQDDCGRAADT
jgi:hypothetical protein